MSASDALSNRQFYTEQNMISQGNLDELATRVRGVQNMTANVFKPSFSSDYQAFQPNPSPASPPVSSLVGSTAVSTTAKRKARSRAELPFEVPAQIRRLVMIDRRRVPLNEKWIDPVLGQRSVERAGPARAPGRVAPSGKRAR